MRSDGIKTGITVGFFVSLLVYHFTRIQLNTYLSQNAVSDWLSFWSLAESFASFLVFALIVYTKIVPWITGLVGGFYIDGKYEGWGFAYDQKNRGMYRRTNKRPQYIERYAIKQTLFDVSISGESFDPKTKALVSTWYGKLYQIEGDNLAYFAITLIGGHTETGILSIKFANNEAHGFYHSGRPGNQYAYGSSCKKVNVFQNLLITQTE